MLCLLTTLSRYLQRSNDSRTGPSATGKRWGRAQAWESCRKVLVWLLGPLLGWELPSG